MSLTEPREVTKSIPGEDLMTALRNEGPGGGWSRQRELHLLELQREPCSKCSLNLEEETGREAEEEGKAQLGKSLDNSED